MICFLSSPFTEPAGVEWPARKRLYDQLVGAGHSPWRYEVEGKKLEALGGDPKEIITCAIASADVVIMFFKTRAGSYFSEGPFRGTDYEYWEARRLRTPIYLYLIGHVRDSSLNATLSILADPLVLLRAATPVETDGDELDQVVASDIERESNSRLLSSHKDSSREARPLSGLDRPWLEQELRALQVSVGQNLWAAVRQANRIPIEPQLEIAPYLRTLYAGVLDICGGILANQWRYDEAITAKKLSIRCFAESGATRETFGQIQALSGILNMARLPEAARANEYGFSVALRSYPELVPAFHDSRASILVRLKNPGAAREHIRKAIQMEGPKPYLLSKYARAIAASRKPGDIRLATTIIFDKALPMARAQDRSLGYTLRDAAFIAMLNQEFSLAASTIAEAEADCLKRGELHTLAGVKQVKAILGVRSTRKVRR